MAPVLVVFTGILVAGVLQSGAAEHWWCGADDALVSSGGGGYAAPIDETLKVVKVSLIKQQVTFFQNDCIIY